MRTDLVVLAKDYPEVRLMAEVKPSVANPLDLSGAVSQLAHYMWNANCHYGLIFTPKTTYVLRDDFATQGPEAIRVHNALPTERVLSRMRPRSEVITSERELEFLARIGSSAWQSPTTRHSQMIRK